MKPIYKPSGAAAESMSTPKGYWACEGAFCEKAYKNYLNENQITRPPQSWCYVEA